jgi:hypothetical protein
MKTIILATAAFLSLAVGGAFSEAGAGSPVVAAETTMVTPPLIPSETMGSTAVGTYKEALPPTRAPTWLPWDGVPYNGGSG